MLSCKGLLSSESVDRIHTTAAHSVKPHDFCREESLHGPPSPQAISPQTEFGEVQAAPLKAASAQLVPQADEQFPVARGLMVSVTLDSCTMQRADHSLAPYVCCSGSPQLQGHLQQWKRRAVSLVRMLCLKTWQTFWGAEGQKATSLLRRLQC